MTGEVSNNATWNQAAVGPFDTGTAYFVAMVWNGVTHNATWYWKADEEGSLQSATAGSGLTFGGGQAMDGVWFGTDNGGAIERGSHLTFKKARSWKMTGAPTLGATELLAESFSPTPVITAGLFAVYDMVDEADFGDLSGAHRDLTGIGTMTRGDLDPVDLH